MNNKGQFRCTQCGATFLLSLDEFINDEVQCPECGNPEPGYA